MVDPCGSKVRLTILLTGWRNRATLVRVAYIPKSRLHRRGRAVRFLLTGGSLTSPAAEHEGPYRPGRML